MPDNRGDNYSKKRSLNEDENQTNQFLNSKKTFIFVGVISIAALLLGFFQIYKNIHSPFETKLSINSTSRLTGEQLDKLDSLKSKDTDGDGLSDYDELYFYNTSPYLKDSDSDGYSDKDEINSDNDPNCPAGADCSGVTTRVNTNTNSNQNNNLNNSLVSGQASAQALRQTLRDAGVPQYMLENTSDEELMEIYNQTVDEDKETNLNVNTTNQNLNNNSNINSSTFLTNSSEVSEEDVTNYLESLSASEIRSFLVEYGMSEEDLKGIDDETLRAVFLRALEEQDL